MKIKRSAGILMVLILLASLLLTACQPKVENVPAEDVPTTENDPSEAATPDEVVAEPSIFDLDPAEIEGTITYWSWMPRPETQFPFLLEAWETKYPNIELKYERLKKVDHLVRLKTAMLGGSIADVIAVPLGADAAPYADKVEPLASYAEMSWGAGWQDDFYTLAMDWANDYGDDYPFMPVGLTAQPIIVYDANVLRDVGVEVPETYEEVLDVLSKFEGNENILPHVGSGLLEAEKPIIVFFALCEQIEPGAYLAAANGEKEWTDPVFEQAFTNFGRLFDDGFFPEDAFSVALYPDITYDSFVNEVRYPMILAGSYFMGEVVPSAKEASGNTDRRFGVIPFPNLEGGDPVVLTIVDQALAIPQNAENKELAWLFIEFMATDYQPITAKLMEQFPSKSGIGLDISIMNNEDEKAAAQTLSDVIENNANSSGTSRAAIEYPELTQAIYDGLVAYVLGGEDVNTVLSSIQQVSDTIDRK